MSVLETRLATAGRSWGWLLTQVLPGLEVAGDGELLLALVGDEVVHGPGAPLETLLVDLGPDRLGGVAVCVGCDPGRDGSLVARGDNVIPACVVILVVLIVSISGVSWRELDEQELCLPIRASRCHQQQPKRTRAWQCLRRHRRRESD